MKKFYDVQAISCFNDKPNKPFVLTVKIAIDLSTNDHIYVVGCRKDGFQYTNSYFRNGKKKIKENKQGKYIEFSNEPRFKKVRIYL